MICSYTLFSPGDHWVSLTGWSLRCNIPNCYKWMVVMMMSVVMTVKMTIIMMTVRVDYNVVSNGGNLFGFTWLWIELPVPINGFRNHCTLIAGPKVDCCTNPRFLKSSPSSFFKSILPDPSSFANPCWKYWQRWEIGKTFPESWNLILPLWFVQFLWSSLLCSLC